MRGMPFPDRCEPPWRRGFRPWTADERFRRQYQTRVRFFRRFAAIAVLMTLFAVGGVMALAWLAVRTTGVGAVSPVLIPLALLAVLFLGGMTALMVVGRTVRRVVTPLGAVMDAAERVSAGDYDVRVPERGAPPMRALARAFNTMTARLGSHDRQRRELMADVAHELRTPLTIMQGTLEGMLDGVYPLDDRQLAEALEQTRVLSRLVDDLRTLALSESGALTLDMEMTDVGSLARDVARAFAADASGRGVTLQADAPELPPIAVDPLRIREVLSNLVSNALRHTPAGGTVRLRAASTEADVTVDVRDTGSGMTEEELQRAFDRFHKGPGSQGSGLGLTIARSLVAAHHGDIRASSAPGRGTTMTVTLPRGDRD
jgi:signal transduction histidine kinase